MRNGYLKFKEEFPSNFMQICVELGKAIQNDNLNALNQLIYTHFSKPENIRFLEGSISVYWDSDEEAHFHPPAVMAVMLRSPNVLRAILKHTLNPNGRVDPDAPENSPTLLMQAILSSDIDMVKLLLEEGANVNDKWIFINDEGEESTHFSALSLAIHQGLTKTTNLLLDNGAAPTVNDASSVIQSSDGLDPLLEKMIGLYPELLHESQESGGLLHRAATGNNLTSIKWLLGQGANLNAIAGDGTTPLDWAVSANKKEIVAFLQSVGGIPGQVNESQASDSPTKQEITKNVERLELLEEKFGITLSGLYASCEARTWDAPVSYGLTINFDVASPTGAELGRSFSIRASAYNSAGQLLGTESAGIYKDDFLGFASMSITLYVDQAPEKIRLFPAT